jgi:hypothetical protein
MARSGRNRRGHGSGEDLLEATSDLFYARTGYEP